MIDLTLKTIDQVEAFLSAASQVDFSFADVPARYAGMTATLARFCYHQLSKSDKCVLRHYRHRFVVKYTAADIRLLVRTDALHNTLSGPATKKILERAHHIFGDIAFVRLARISVSHLYNLRPPLAINVIAVISSPVVTTPDQRLERLIRY